MFSTLTSDSSYAVSIFILLQRDFVDKMLASTAYWTPFFVPNNLQAFTGKCVVVERPLMTFKSPVAFFSGFFNWKLALSKQQNAVTKVRLLMLMMNAANKVSETIFFGIKILSILRAYGWQV